MRQLFEDSCNMNILKWKLYQKINSIMTWSSRKVEFLWDITSFLALKFEHVNHLFPVQRALCTFNDLAEYGFKFFAKIMKGSCVFCYSSCIGFNPTSYLNNLFLQITNHLWLRPPWYIIHYNLFSFHGSRLVSRFSNQEIYYECVKVPMPTHQL